MTCCAGEGEDRGSDPSFFVTGDSSEFCTSVEFLLQSSDGADFVAVDACNGTVDSDWTATLSGNSLTITHDSGGYVTTYVGYDKGDRRQFIVRRSSMLTGPGLPFEMCVTPTECVVLDYCDPWIPDTTNALTGTGGGQDLEYYEFFIGDFVGGIFELEVVARSLNGPQTGYANMEYQCTYNDGTYDYLTFYAESLTFPSGRDLPIVGYYQDSVTSNRTGVVDTNGDWHYGASISPYSYLFVGKKAGGVWTPFT